MRAPRSSWIAIRQSITPVVSSNFSWMFEIPTIAKGIFLRFADSEIEKEN